MDTPKLVVQLEREEDGRWIEVSGLFEEIGPRMLGRIARSTGLTPRDL